MTTHKIEKLCKEIKKMHASISDSIVEESQGSEEEKEAASKFIALSNALGSLRHAEYKVGIIQEAILQADDDIDDEDVKAEIEAARTSGFQAAAMLRAMRVAVEEELQSVANADIAGAKE